MNSKRNLKSLPQVESTVYLGITSPIMKFIARESFRVGNVCIAQGETCFAVKSVRREHRYYIVHWNTSLQTWQCSCGCSTCEHDHLKTVREYVEMHDIKVQIQTPATAKVAQVSNHKAENTPVKPDWKAIMKADKARQRKWQQEYREAANKLKKEAV